jgi:hypothetical protein
MVIKMTFLSFVINTGIFFLLLNSSYFSKKRVDPDYPDKPFNKLVLFPLALGVVFTLIVDSFRGVMIYQLILFIIVMLLLYCIFYIFQKNN